MGHHASPQRPLPHHGWGQKLGGRILAQQFAYPDSDTRSFCYTHWTFAYPDPDIDSDTNFYSYPIFSIDLT
jgi:hypothetical protein